jgi:hypothetical protein
MKQGICSQCGMTTTIRSFYSMNGKTYCEPCVWKASREAKDAGQAGDYAPLADHTICARCGMDNGTSDLPVYGKLPLCSSCAPAVTDFPYPQWLKVSLVGLLALLAVSLVHGRKYFQAGRNMYIGERLVEKKEYAKAIPYLKQTLQVAPGSDKAALLAAKAGLLSGDVETAQKALNGHNNGYFEHADSEEFQEVDGMWKRAIAALDKADQAQKIEEQGGQDHDAEAARLMHEAAQEYPEARGLAVQAEYADAGVAFDNKDYDGFLSISQDLWKKFPGAGTAASVASALACKYAVTSDESLKQQAEEMLAKAKQMTAPDKESQAGFQEYFERIRYRIDKKDIISKQEYDRRFRSGQAEKK